MTNEERSRSTKKGLRAEELVRRAVGGKKGKCDVHTHLGGFELRWGPTTKNAAGMDADRARSRFFDGYCVQIAGAVSAGNRARGDRSLFDFLRHHGFDVSEASKLARYIREQASNGFDHEGDPNDDQMRLA